MGARPRLEEGAIVTIARRPADLEKLVPAWEELAHVALEPNPFYEHWMLLPALAHLDNEVEIALVWQEGRLAGLFPFRKVRRYKGLPASAAVSWQHQHCLLCTPLVRADSARICLEALMDALDVSLVEFRYLPAGEPFHRTLVEVLAARGMPSLVNRSYSRGLLRKQRATISAKFKRQAAKIERLAGLRRAELKPDDEVERWIEDFLCLEASGWKGREGSAMACSEANRRFFRAIVTEAFRRVRLLGCGLDVGERPIARRLSFTAGEGAYAFKIAYDESYAGFSPGAVLELDNVRQVDADPRIQWMDAYTDANVLAVERLWPDRRVMQTLVTGGRVAIAALACLRWAKRRLR